MEISPYYSSVDSDKYLKQVEEQIKLLSSQYSFLQSSVSDIEAITETENQQKLDTNQTLNSEYYTSSTLIDSERDDTYNQSISDQMSSIEMLGKFQALKDLSLESLESNGVNDYGKSIDDYYKFTGELMQRFDLDIETMKRITEEDIDQIKKNTELREKMAKKREAARMKKYAEDFKFMLKIFTPGTSMFEATEILADAYMKIFQSMS